MNRRLLTTLATAAILVASFTAGALACEDKTSTAKSASNAKSGACTAEMAAQCTPAQAAACKARGASATTASAGEVTCSGHAAMSASAGGCASKSATAAANAHVCGAGNSATTAEQSGCPFAKNAQYSACPHHGMGASMASASGGCEHGAKGAAVTAQRFDAAVTGGSTCSGHGMASFADGASMQAGCDACADMARCVAEVKAAGGQTQVVKLKNGVMYVYTAENPSQVRAVQAAMARRSDRLVALTAAGDRAKLCPECKSMRGAIASGKLNREIVTIEGGCLTLMTSNDPSIVAKLHRMAGTEMAARIKS